MKRFRHTWWNTKRQAVKLVDRVADAFEKELTIKMLLLLILAELGDLLFISALLSAIILISATLRVVKQYRKDSEPKRLMRKINKKFGLYNPTIRYSPPGTQFMQAEDSDKPGGFQTDEIKTP